MDNACKLEDATNTDSLKRIGRFELVPTNSLNSEVFNKSWIEEIQTLVVKKTQLGNDACQEIFNF